MEGHAHQSHDDHRLEHDIAHEQRDGEARGKLRLWPATLYGSLEDLVALGWIEELTERGDRPKGESERKRFYRITRDGARILGAEADRLQALAQTALERVATGRAAR
jgi:DNA-binding PadR family transcriptional regulator